MSKFTHEELAALLRAAKHRLEYLGDQTARLHFTASVEEDCFLRQQAEISNVEYKNLQSAVRKLWLTTST